MLLIISMIVSVVAGVGVEIWRYRALKKEEEKTSKGKIVAEALEQAIIIFLSAIFALWLTNLSENIKIKDQTKKVLYASSDELETTIDMISGGVVFGDQAFIGQLYSLVKYERILDMREFMFNESIFMNLDPIIASNITRFEANYEMDFNTLKLLLDNPDEGDNGNLILSYAADVANDAYVLLGNIRKQIAYIDGRTIRDYTPLYVPQEIEERYNIILEYIQGQRNRH